MGRAHAGSKIKRATQDSGSIFAEDVEDIDMTEVHASIAEEVDNG